MHDGMPYGRIQGQGHSREVDRQSPTGLIFLDTLLEILNPVISDLYMHVDLHKKLILSVAHGQPIKCH